MAFDAFVAGQPLQGQTIGFTFVSQNMGMGRAEDEIHDVRMLRHNGRQGGDDIFDPFVGGEQAKAQQDHFPFDSKEVFVKTGVCKRHIGNAVWDEINFLRRNPVDLLQEFHTTLTHHNHPI